MSSIFDFFKKIIKRNDNMKYADVLNGWTPVFGQGFGQNIYASDVVQQALWCIAGEMKKLDPQHVRKRGEYQVAVQDSPIQRALDNPNQLMTTSDFIEKIIWQLFFNYNSFVIPTWNKQSGELESLYPIQPQQVDFLQDPTGTMFVKLSFSNGYEGTIKYSDVIHIRHHFSVNEFMGGNEAAQPDHKALLKTLELNDTMLNGVAKALKSSFAINGVVKYNTIIDGAKTEAALKQLTDALNNNENGFMPLDMKGEFIPFERQIQMVDATTLKFIDEKILRHFGVSLPILTGDYTKRQYEAFYQKTLEPLIISISQAFTKALFSDRERGFKNQIIFYAKEMNFMTTDEKIRYFTLLSNTGGCTVNELRVGMGMKPLDDEEAGNMLIMSKNFGDANSVKDMDMTQKSEKDKKEDKKEADDDEDKQEQQEEKLKNNKIGEEE